MQEKLGEQQDLPSTLHVWVYLSFFLFLLEYILSKLWRKQVLPLIKQ